LLSEGVPGNTSAEGSLTQYVCLEDKAKRPKQAFRATLPRFHFANDKRRIPYSKVHFSLHGGLTGVRDEGAIESALARPRHRYAYAEDELDLAVLHNLTSIGRWLIGARIARGWSISDLAERLGVSPQQISRDENNEYRNGARVKQKRAAA